MTSSVSKIQSGGRRKYGIFAGIQQHQQITSISLITKERDNPFMNTLKKPLLSLFGFVVLLALIWVLLTVVKGIVGAVLTVLAVILAAAVLWKLVKAGTHPTP